jgi:hypothetical protein
MCDLRVHFSGKYRGNMRDLDRGGVGFSHPILLDWSAILDEIGTPGLDFTES